MNVSIHHPTDKANFSEVTIGRLTLFFSYKTVIGVFTPDDGAYVRENDWGPTTGKHINWIMDQYGIKTRMSSSDFDDRLEAITNLT